MRVVFCLLILMSIFIQGCDPYQRGNIMLEREQYEKAIEFFLEKKAQKPDEPRARNQLGFAYLQLGKNSEAIQELNMAIGLKSDYFEAYNNLGLVYMNIYNWPKAEDCFLKALELKPDSEDAHASIAWTYEKMWMPDKALKHAKRARELSTKPDSHSLLFDKIAKNKVKVDQRNKKENQ
jgi:Tfp pilus assembly protein PilF